jgi:hypothetical protein
MVRMRRDPIFHVTPVNRPETHCARNAFPSVKSLREFCLNLDSVSSAMWNLGRSCRDATIGSLQSNRRKSLWITPKIWAPIRLFVRRQNFLNTHLIDQVFSLQIDEMCSLFIVGQICADPLRHDHD